MYLGFALSNAANAGVADATDALLVYDASDMNVVKGIQTLTQPQNAYCCVGLILVTTDW